MYSYVFKPYGIESIIKKINALCNMKEQSNKNDNIREKISYHLSNLGYNPSHNGTRYLADTIFELYLKKDLCCENLKRDIYPILASQYNKTANNIKCSMTKATKIMCVQCNEEIFKEYFKYYNTNKPTVKEVVFTILGKI